MSGHAGSPNKEGKAHSSRASSAVHDNVKGTISDALAHIFNLCIDQGYFPDELKLGRITPIHKKGSKSLISNYRPVCNLSPFSKIFERIVYNRMVEFIDKFNIFSPTQYGFRKEMGTETALVDFTDYIYKGLTKKLNVCTRLFCFKNLNICWQRLRVSC